MGTAITMHFAFEEFVKRPRDFDKLPKGTRVQLMDHFVQVATVLERIRIVLGGPIVLTSGWRSPQHNIEVGGSETSDHVKGWAVDFQRPGIHPRAVYSEVSRMMIKGDLPEIDQLIGYPKHVHIGLGPRRRAQRWTVD